MTDSNHRHSTAEKLITSGRISRREFIQLAIASGLTATAADDLFVSVARATPRRGGTFRVGLGHGSTTDNLDPGTYGNGFTFSMSVGLFGAMLVEVAPNGDIIPALAESWEPADGGAKWIFKLRKGVQFHDGRSVRPEDVVANFNFHRDEKSKSAIKSLFEAVTDVKADGENVVCTLKAPNFDFPALTADYHFPILPATEGKVEWEKGIGAGPYVMKSFEAGRSFVGERNPNYFRSDAAWFDRIELSSIIDVAARTTSLKAGEIDYMDRTDLKTVDRLKTDQRFVVTNVPSNAQYTAPMHCDKAPFDKLEVRQALKWAINRKELVQKILWGYGVPGNDFPIGQRMKFFSQPTPIHEYDPEKAKSILKRAGLSDLKVDFSTSEAAFAGAVDAGVLMAAQAKLAGIEINVIREPDDGYWDNVWLKKPWTMCYWGGRPTCDVIYTAAYAADAPWNDTHWKNPRFNELLVAARAESDEKKRADKYSEMHQLCHDDGGQIVLMFNNFVSAHSAKVAHSTELNSDWDWDGGHMYHRWWFS